MHHNKQNSRKVARGLSSYLQRSCFEWITVGLASIQDKVIFEPIAPDCFLTHFSMFSSKFGCLSKMYFWTVDLSLRICHLEIKFPFQALWWLLPSVTISQGGDWLTFPKVSNPLAFPSHMLPFSSLGAPHPQPYGSRRTKLLLEWHDLYLPSWMDRECLGGW